MQDNSIAGWPDPDIHQIGDAMRNLVDLGEGEDAEEAYADLADAVDTAIMKVRERLDAKKPASDPLGPKYPQVKVRLSGHDSNAMAIMGSTTEAMRKAGISVAERDEYRREAMSGSYDQLIQTTMRWVNVS